MFPQSAQDGKADAGYQKARNSGDGLGAGLKAQQGRQDQIAGAEEHGEEHPTQHKQCHGG